MEKSFSKEELQNFDGKDGRPAYIVYDGIVYDVTGNPYWADGSHLNLHPSGVDLTDELGEAPHGPEVFEGLTRVGVLKV